MTTKTILFTFTFLLAAFVLGASLWPLNNRTDSKSDRLAGQSVETAFLPERFGVPTPPATASAPD